MLKASLLMWGHSKVQNGAEQWYCRAHFGEVISNPQIGVSLYGERFSKKSNLRMI